MEIEPVPDGPTLVRGATSLQSTDGVAHQVERPVVAVCACGFSRRLPWCDGSHKAAKAGSARSVILTVDAARFKS